MWKYYNPVEVVFGTGKLDELGQLMAERGLDRALIVSDPFTHRQRRGHAAEGVRGRPRAGHHL